MIRARERTRKRNRISRLESKSNLRLGLIACCIFENILHGPGTSTFSACIFSLSYSWRRKKPKFKLNFKIEQSKYLGECQHFFGKYSVYACTVKQVIEILYPDLALCFCKVVVVLRSKRSMQCNQQNRCKIHYSSSVSTVQ